MTKADYDFSPGLVVLSYGISFLGAYVAIGLCEQLRQSMIDDKAINGSRVSISHRKKHLMLLFLMSLSIAGVGIWSMHFIGMHALMLYDEQGTVMEMKYNVTLSVLSFICVLFTTFAGMTTASYDVMFSKNKQEILEQLISDTKKLSMNEIRRIDYKKMLIIISTKRLGRLLLGGVITGGGVSVMHYLGMVAMIFDGRIVWNPAIVFASVLVAIVAATAAFWIFFRLLSIFPEMEVLRLVSAVIMGIAVCGMHYTGMTAATYVYADEFQPVVRRDMLHDNMDNKQSYSSALIGANLMLWMIAMYMIWNSRVQHQRQSKLLQQADQMAQFITLESPTSSLQGGSMTPILSSSAGGAAAAASVVNNHNYNHNASTSNHIRKIAEMYLAKRFRSRMASSRHRKQVHAMDVASPGGSEASTQLRSNTSFTQFIGFSLYWLVTCRWSMFYAAWFADADDGGQSSTHGSDENSAQKHSHTSESSIRRYHNKHPAQNSHHTQSSLLPSVVDHMKPVPESDLECLQSLQSSPKLPMSPKSAAINVSSTTLSTADTSNTATIIPGHSPPLTGVKPGAPIVGAPLIAIRNGSGKDENACTGPVEHHVMTSVYAISPRESFAHDDERASQSSMQLFSVTSSHGYGSGSDNRSKVFPQERDSKDSSQRLSDIV